MTKIFVLHKFKELKSFLYVFLLVILTTSGQAQKQNQKKLNLDTILQESKSIFTQGKRKEAILKLNEALILTKSKKQQSQILAKRTLFSEQFFTSEAFQKYELAKSFAQAARWQDCLREIELVSQTDLNNILVLRIKSLCQIKLPQMNDALKSIQEILEFFPDDFEANLNKVEISLIQRSPLNGLGILEKIEPKTSLEVERIVIFKAKLLEMLGRSSEAVDVLRKDQETYLEHIEVLYELGTLYSRISGNDWLSRKFLLLFISRCKRIPQVELKKRSFDLLIPKTQALLLEIDKRLGIDK